MSSTTLRVVIWAVVIVVCAAAIYLAIAAALSQSGRSESRSGMEETPSAAPAPSPPSEVPPVETDSPEVHADSILECGSLMPPEEYESFIQRLMEYEAIRLSGSSDRIEQMTSYATESFLRTQTDVGNDITTTVTISLETPSPYECLMENSTTIYAYVTPVVTIIDLNTGEIQQQNRPLPIHSTTWIKVESNWLVNRERF